MSFYLWFMCGKFTQMMSWGRYVELADLIGVGAAGGPVVTVTPMREASVICLNADGQREARPMRWGFIPAWAKDPMAGPHHIHARAEGIETKKTFRNAFFERRGLVIVQTFNEGEEIRQGKPKLQHVITPNNGEPIAIAVIWEVWGEPHAGELATFAMMTVPANTLIGTITDRMPAIVQPKDWDKWLGEEPANLDELKAILKPFEGDWSMARQGKPSRSPKAPPEPTLFTDP